MTYLISNIIPTLIATLLLGVGIGWLVWGRLKSRLASLETNWSNRYQSLESEYNSIITECDEVEAAFKDRVAHIKTLNHEQNELSNQLSTANNAKDELSKKLDAIKKQLTQTTANYRFSNKELEEHREQLAALQDTPDEISELKTLLGQATQRYNNNGLELKNKTEELTALQESFEESSTHAASMHKELDLLRTQLLKRDKEFESQVVSYANLQNQLSDSNEMLRIVQTELDARDKNSVDRSELTTRDEKITVLQNSLQDVSEKYEETLNDLQSTKQKLPVLVNEASVLRDRIPELEASLKQRDSSISALENEITRLANEFPPLRDELETRNTEASELKQQVYTLQQRIPAFKSTIAARDAHIRELEVFVNEAQKAILQPSNLALVKNGNGHLNGKPKNGNGATNGNNGQLNGKPKNGNTANIGSDHLNGKSKNGSVNGSNGHDHLNGKSKNGNTASISSDHLNGKSKNGSVNGKATKNGNVIQLNGNSELKATSKANEKKIKQVSSSTKPTSNKVSAENGKTTAKKTAKNKIKSYGLKKPIRKPDDLKLITGIGETLEKTLHKCGIFYFEQIANFNLKDVKTVDELLNFRGRIDRDDWIRQARNLMKASKKPLAAKKTPAKRTTQPRRANRRPKMKPLGMKRPSGEIDDLQLINGVGPTLERKLHRLGIYHYEQLAQLTAEDIALIDSKLKTYKGRLKRDKWPMQARRLYKEFHTGA